MKCQSDYILLIPHQYAVSLTSKGPDNRLECTSIRYMTAWFEKGRVVLRHRSLILNHYNFSRMSRFRMQLLCVAYKYYDMKE
jgi:hypothetical protein